MVENKQNIQALENIASLAPNTAIEGIENLDDLMDFLVLVGSKYGEAREPLTNPYAQLTDSASLRGWGFQAKGLPQVTFLGEGSVVDKWVGGNKTQHIYRSRPGFGERVNGHAFEVLQNFKLGSRKGTIHKTVLVGAGEQSGLIKYGCIDMPDNRSPKVVMNTVRKVAGNAIRNATSAGAPTLGKRK